MTTTPLSLPFRSTRARRRGVTLSGGLVLLLGAASGLPAHAGPAAGPVAWTRVTDLTGSNIDQLGLARGTDGVLHIVWRRGSGPYALVDTPVSAAGRVGAPTTVSAGWAGAGYPDAVAGSNGIAAFWNGVKTASGHPDGTFQARRPSSGGSWTSTTTPVVRGSTIGDGADTSAGAGPDNAFWTSYVGTGTFRVTELGKPSHQLAGSECCIQSPGLATDGVTGDAVAGYYNDGTAVSDSGTFVRQFDAVSGAPTGSRVKLPGSSDRQGQAIPPDQRVATAGRGAGLAGVYVAYSTGYPIPKGVRVWGTGAAGSTVLGAVGPTGSVPLVALTPDGLGGLWALWIRTSSGHSSLMARHSDATVTTWGAPQTVALPAGTSEAYHLIANARGNAVDVLVQVDLHFQGSIAYYASRVHSP